MDFETKTRAILTAIETIRETRILGCASPSQWWIDHQWENIAKAREDDAALLPADVPFWLDYGLDHLGPKDDAQEAAWRADEDAHWLLRYSVRGAVLDWADNNLHLLAEGKTVTARDGSAESVASKDAQQFVDAWEKVRQES